MGDNVRIALISAAAALLGGLIAGGASLATTALNQQGENERVEHRLDEEARGVARVLVSRLTTELSFIEQARRRGSYGRSPSKFLVAPVPSTDLKLLNARLPPTDFEDIDLAMREAVTFTTLAEERTGEEPNAYEQGLLEEFQDNVTLALQELYLAADLPTS